jgi:hypothetical protein
VEFPDSSKAVYSQTDGSGAERYQLLDNGERGVIGFASRILRGPGLSVHRARKGTFGDHRRAPEVLDHSGNKSIVADTLSRYRLGLEARPGVLKLPVLLRF